MCEEFLDQALIRGFEKIIMPLLNEIFQMN